MKNHKKYRSTVIDLFQSFLAGKIGKKEMIYSLYDIEVELINGRRTLKSVWFRFFKGDTTATTIRDLENDFINYANDNYVKECMQLSIDNPKELKIYFS